MSKLAAIVNPSIANSVGNFQGPGWISPGYVLQTYLRNFINLALGIGGLYFFFTMIMGGYQYISAGGDKEAVQKATARLRNGFVGVIVLFSIFVIIWFVETIFAIPIRQVNIPTVVP